MMEYNGYTMEIDKSDNYYAVHIRERGMIVHTTTYFNFIEIAVKAAMRWIERTL